MINISFCDNFVLLTTLTVLNKQFGKINVKLVFAIFYQVFIFHQMIALQKL